MVTDHYQVLGVPKDATMQDIKNAYRKLAKESHPDHGGDPDRFKQIALAYEVLSDPDRRKRYDTTGKDDQRSGSPAMELIRNAVDHAINLPESESGDLIAKARDMIKANLKSAEKSSIELTKELAKLRKRRAKLRHNETLYDQDAWDIVSGIFDHNIDVREHNLEECKKAIAIINEAVAMLDGIECDCGETGSTILSSLLSQREQATWKRLDEWARS